MPIIFNDEDDDFLIGPGSSDSYYDEPARELTPEEEEARRKGWEKNTWVHQYGRVYKNSGAYKIGSPVAGPVNFNERRKHDFKVSFDFVYTSVYKN